MTKLPLAGKTGSWSSLPQVRLVAGAPLSHQFRERGCADVRAAARWVFLLPYGRNSDRSDYQLVLQEHRGTCSTKHALIAALADEIALDLDLVLGIYEMNGSNTPGVGPVLAAAGLEALPEAHTYLKLGEHRIDITRPAADVLASSTILYEERIAPGDIGEYKIQCHKAYLGRWLSLRSGLGMSVDDLWSVRERCIAALEESKPDRSASG